MRGEELRNDRFVLSIHENIEKLAREASRARTKLFTYVREKSFLRFFYLPPPPIMSFNSTIRNEIFNFRRRAPFTILSLVYFFDGTEMVINLSVFCKRNSFQREEERERWREAYFRPSQKLLLHLTRDPHEQGPSIRHYYTGPNLSRISLEITLWHIICLNERAAPAALTGNMSST